MPKITPKQYQEILEGISLKGLSLVKSNCVLNEKNKTEKMDIEIDEKSAYVSKGNDVFVTQKYCLTVGDKRRYFLKVECKYQLIFETKKEFSKEFFKIYKQLSLPTNIWPFFREYVFDMSSKMYIPPLILPLKRIVRTKPK